MGWTRAELAGAQEELWSRGSAVKPAVRLLRTSRGEVVVKDLHGLRPPGRWLAAWLLSRERRVLERLAGVPGVPPVLGVLEDGGLVLGRMAGRPLDREAFARRPRELAGALRELVAAMHDRGVYHLDLHQRRNLLVDPAGRLSVVDFGAALAPGPLGRRLWGPLLARVDRAGVLKYLARYAPEELTPAEARAFLRWRRWRRWWPFTRHPDRGEEAAARRRAP